MKKLPDAEFEIMKIVWSLPEPVVSPMVMEKLHPTGVKQQTVVTVLSRLEKKGFLRSVKHGKEREYFAVIGEDEYLRFEAERFAGKFGKKAFSSLASAFYRDGSIGAEELDELRRWLDGRSS